MKLSLIKTYRVIVFPKNIICDAILHNIQNILVEMKHIKNQIKSYEANTPLSDDDQDDLNDYINEYEECQDDLIKYRKDVKKNLKDLTDSYGKIDTDVFRLLQGKGFDNSELLTKANIALKTIRKSLEAEIKKSRRLLYKTYKTAKRVAVLNTKCLDSSTKMRYEFSKQFVKEYFEDIIFDDYFNE